MAAQVRDSNFPRVRVGAWHRVKKRISRDAEDVEAVAHQEITSESSYMSAESTGMVASTCHRYGCPMSLEFSFINSWGKRASNHLAWMQKVALQTKQKTQCLLTGPSQGT